MHNTLERARAIGSDIGHYRIVGVIGEGSLGPLYCAEPRGVQGVSKIVALRCVRPELAGGADFRAPFLEAASNTPRFEHPNVVTIFELGEAGAAYFISMEYVPGEQLASILTKCAAGPHMPPTLAAHVVKQVANAVQYLHERRVDNALPAGLGPGEVGASNVFVTYHGTVKLLAGLGQVRVANRAAMSGEHRVGASDHSLDHAASDPIEYADRRTDVFSLGALLWSCLTSRRPEQAHVAAAGSAPIQAPARFPDPSSVRADVPEALGAIVRRALSPEPGERFQTARELSEALDRYLLQRGSLPTPKHVRRWLEACFGAERAEHQLQIARGHDLAFAFSPPGGAGHAAEATSVAPSRASVRPRELWATSPSAESRRPREAFVPMRSLEPGPASVPHEHAAISSIVVRRTSTLPEEPAAATAAQPSHTPQRAPRALTWFGGAALAICCVVAMGTAALLSSSGGSSPLRAASPSSQVPARSGQVEVQSTPAGAAVFVDGEPTGLYTPVVLKGLSVGRKLVLRVDKAGYKSQTREIAVADGAVETHAFELTASVGVVRFAGAPPGARIYVDDVLADVEHENPINLAAGPHKVRVEAQGTLIFSGAVDVVAGEQTVRVGGTEVLP